MTQLFSLFKVETILTELLGWDSLIDTPFYEWA